MLFRSTIYATILLPMVVITGFFGMNFAHLPLVESEYGTTLVYILMLVSTVGLVYYFRRKRWL